MDFYTVPLLMSTCRNANPHIVPPRFFFSEVVQLVFVKCTIFNSFKLFENKDNNKITELTMINRMKNYIKHEKPKSLAIILLTWYRHYGLNQET